MLHIRRVAISLARADLNVSVVAWEEMPIVELFQWYNDVSQVITEQDKGA